jgi:hypothetical protein
MVKCILELPVGKTDVTDINAFSTALIDDLKVLLASSRYQGGKGHGIKSISSRFRVLITACRFVINNIDHTECLQQGLHGFIDDQYALLKSVYVNAIRKTLFNELLTALVAYTGEAIPRHCYQNYLWSFYFDNSNSWRYIDSADLMATLPNVYSEMQDLLANETELLSQKNYGMETLHTRFSKMKRLILNYLLPEFELSLQTHGLQALGVTNNKIQKWLFQTIQSDVQQKVISLRTGTGYFEVIRWLMEVTGQQATDAYRLSMKRYQVHAKREQMEKTYSDEELTELVFHLEKAIAQSDCSKTLLTLYFAKIQIKTCWNTAPMCAIELDDIKEIELPTSKKTMVIMLQKARKGYDIDTFKLDGRTVNSVMQDLLKVKALTQDYRETSSFKHLLFINHEYGEVIPVKGASIIAYINSLLEDQGCTVRYNSQRIRKSGANYIYREVAKDLRKYKQRLRHSYSTFIKHYQQVEEVNTQLTLDDAVTTMQNYFTGREISSEIIIIEQDDANMQQTPTGLCSSKGNDLAALQYHKEHRLLHGKNGQEPTWCSDYLACIWCKFFRTVADPEHVWQLLSYRDYVLADMRASVLNLEDNEQQTGAFDALQLRVEQILEQLKVRDARAVEQAENLLKTRGMHPFWSFAISSVSMEV